MLHLTRYGGGEALPLLVAHGFLGSARNLGPLARRLADERAVLSVDMRNHGDSAFFDTHDYAAMAADLAEVIEAEGRAMAVFGHSMGGKAAMMLALRRPELVAALIVGDIAPVAYAHSHIGNIEAMALIDPAVVASRREADEILASRIADPATRAFLLQSLDLAEKRWKVNLPVLGAAMDKVVGWPEMAGTYNGPCLFLRGEHSDYITIAQHDAIRAHFPTARIETLAGAGHWIHADAPEPTAAAIRQFLHSLS